MCSSQVEKQVEVLPKNLKPSNYDIQIFDIDAVANTFSGRVAITMEILQNTSEVVLNVRDLEVASAKVQLTVTKTEQEIPVVEITSDKKQETVTLKLAEPLKAAPSASLVVTLNYTGLIQTNMAGFYRSRYTNAEGQDAVMLSTQFEATDARRAFPCFDEPNLKATFDVAIVLRADWTVLSNMPELESRTLDSGKKGPGADQELKLVRFETTPIVSTYLVAWAMGDFECIETTTAELYNGKPLPVRVFTTKGIVEQGRFALEMTAKTLDFFSQKFEIPYALPKVDLIAVHEFSHGAMENWGLITFRSTAILYDPAKSDPKYQKNVAYVVAHELAHQWFGNLVTMNWWDELWLNEGFATYAGFMAVDNFYPDWKVFDAYVSESLQSALNLDALRGSHPIEVPVYSALDIDQVFDAISYLKGSSTIRMLATTIGVDTFFRGVAKYLNRHKYSNATTANLWAAVGEVSGVDVAQIMESWIQKIGFPVLSVSETEDHKLKITQDRFLLSGDVKPEENETKWWIPLNIASDDTDVVKALEAKELVIDKPANFIKLNKDSVGVYRVSYTPELFSNITANIETLNAKDKVGLIADAASCAKAGLSATSTLLKLAKALSGESEFVVWSELINRVGEITSTWYQQPEPVQKALNKFARELYGPASAKIGYEVAETDGFLTLQLRAKLMLAAGLAGVPEVVAFARKTFDSYARGEKIHPSLRIAVFSTVLAADTVTAADFDLVLKEVLTPSSLDGREIALQSLGCTNTAVLGNKAVTLLSDVPTMDAHYLSVSLAANTDARHLLWDYFAANYDALYKAMSTNMVVLDRFVKVSLGSFADIKEEEKIRAFFEGKDTNGFQRSLSQILNKISGNAIWVNKDAGDVEAWLKAEHYL
ncbi:hypothetical protein BABINDRAFT_33484 [Babjeviella inositovora NRRL Y-12698]|uniref:Aminopeptidase n=1 Tax=Babjeviella inositovora NRRL Y-12698 TaxID=984486 RepID=A0A1E3QU47_9ASCO|nr:uncharacterized protein BABINDRAFT_33484 [Babjeviella inositovora NRRL Y-12698]ODQ81228.1 hypothetical protein BABINDRAFT_33484 [Babjeviella inositovora NRRL Y-12698]